MTDIVAPAIGARRRSRFELQEILLRAGRDLLLEEGLSLGAGDLTFKRVFDALEATHGVRLTNASVIRRVWENQAEFQADVLVHLAEAADVSGEAAATLDILVPLAADFDLWSFEGRLRAMQDLARLGGEVSIRSRVATREWSLWMGVWVLSVTGPRDGPRTLVHDALLEGLEQVADLWDQIYEVILVNIGFRLRSGFTMRQFTLSSATLVEGMTARQGGSQEVDLIPLPTGPEGAVEEWTLFGIALDALSKQFFELDPLWTPPPRPA